MRFRISNSAGFTVGTFTGRTPAAALAEMHRAAGFAVRVEGSDVAFERPADADLCGYVAEWKITREPRQ